MNHIKTFNESFQEDMHFFGFDISRISELEFYWEMYGKSPSTGEITPYASTKDVNMIFISSPKGADGYYFDPEDRIDLDNVLSNFLETVPGLTWSKFRDMCEECGFDVRGMNENSNRKDRIGFHVRLKNQEVVEFFDLVRSLDSKPQEK